MTQDEIIAFIEGLPEVGTVRAGSENGAPEAAWGDVFFFHEPGGDPARRRNMPFATVVASDYPGFDTASRLDRPGVFRVNIAVGRELFEELVGYPPAAHAEHADGTDPSQADRIIAHPLYAAQGWVAVVCPGEATSERVRALVRTAREADAARSARRTGGA
ncbi:DUF6194 family protein [Nocardiopsis changdeensis]|uniref:Erythromycin esterase n=1 Tax=Nocardiopsis changdeensis TaxID=2831969 RepID=A0ABX8BTA2_9ACTN|nr:MULTISPECIES: DUF6194 family protein [Nocardiopsis]QUX25470.1 erythromycin esterase [Nocardiopsis changdeensis]QYX35856.1 erythromycin esterase [Nocardiopsis sp. MT53]